MPYPVKSHSRAKKAQRKARGLHCNRPVKFTNGGTVIEAAYPSGAAPTRPRYARYSPRRVLGSRGQLAQSQAVYRGYVQIAAENLLNDQEQRYIMWNPTVLLKMF